MSTNLNKYYKLTNPSPSRIATVPTTLASLDHNPTATASDRQEPTVCMPVFECLCDCPFCKRMRVGVCMFYRSLYYWECVERWERRRLKGWKWLFVEWEEQRHSGCGWFQNDMLQSSVKGRSAMLISCVALWMTEQAQYVCPSLILLWYFDHNAKIK